jgi:hypothetical protein
VDNASAPIPITVVWASDASSPYVLYPVPTSGAGLDPGRASFQFGFPPLTFTSVSSGGVPPFGSDFNGMMEQVTADLQFLQAGTFPTYSGSFSAAIGGYPRDAVVRSVTTPGQLYRSTAENNTSNPDLGGANWIGFPIEPPIPVSQGGTGVTTFVPNEVLTGGDGTAIGQIAPGGGPYPLVSGTPPSYQILSVGGGGTGVNSLPSGRLLTGGATVGSIAPNGSLPLISNTPPAFSQLNLSASVAGGNSDNVSGILSAQQAPVRLLAIFSTAGGTTFTVPSETYWIYGEVVGAGGGGAGHNTNTTNTGGGGGAGGYAAGWFPVTPGNSISITVGSGGNFGVSGTAGTDGGAGGSSSIGAFLSATGGAGGQSVANSAGGDPGVGMIPGGGGLPLYGGYGGDGDDTGATHTAGSGGASFFGGGVRQSAAVPGTPAAFGAGGGGGYNGASGSQGMPGLVVLRG